MTAELEKDLEQFSWQEILREAAEAGEEAFRGGEKREQSSDKRESR